MHALCSSYLPYRVYAKCKYSYNSFSLFNFSTGAVTTVLYLGNGPIKFNEMELLIYCFYAAFSHIVCCEDIEQCQLKLRNVVWYSKNVIIWVLVAGDQNKSGMRMCARSQQRARRPPPPDAPARAVRDHCARVQPRTGVNRTHVRQLTPSALNPPFNSTGTLIGRRTIVFF